MKGASTSTIELPCCPISLLAVAKQECHTKVPNHRYTVSHASAE